MKIAIAGCGFVSYLYGGTLGNHESLQIVGAYDRDPERTRTWVDRFGGQAFPSLEALLAADVEILVNLTNPSSHYEVTRAGLLAGKHVFSEKPMTTELPHARELAALAEARGLRLECAPSTILGETAQTLWRAIQEGVVGRIHTVYTSFQIPFVNGVSVRRGKYESYRRGGAVRAQYAAPKERDFPVEWPLEDEMDVGCAYEHAGYALSWLTSWFGPVLRMTNYTSLRRPDVPWFKLLDDAFFVHRKRSPDLFVTCLSLADDVDVLMLNSTITRWDTRLQLYGETGCLEIADPWNYADPVWIHREEGCSAIYPHVRPVTFRRTYADWYRPNFDYARGVAALARAVASGAPSPHTCGLAQQLHVQEIVDRITDTSAGLAPITTTFAQRPEPLPGAERVGVAIVGCGDVAKHYVETLTGAPGTEIVGALSLSGRGERARSLLGEGRGRVYASLDEVLADERVDVVVNLSAPPRHAELTRACLRARRHVFSEKPLALSLADALELQQVAREHTVRLACAPALHLMPSHVAASRAIREGRIGQPSHVIAGVHHGAIEAWHPNPAPLYALGMYADVGVYALAEITAALGPVWRVAAEGTIVTPTRTRPDGETFAIGAPDRVHARLKLWSGVEVELTCRSDSTDRAWYRANPTFVEYHGDRAMLRVEGMRADRVTLRDHEAGTPLELAPSSPDRTYPFALGALDLVQAIREQRSHRCSVEHAVHLVEVLEAIQRSMAAGSEPVTIRNRFVPAGT
jgi:predicted dehydrogenase